MQSLNAVNNLLIVIVLSTTRLMSLFVVAPFFNQQLIQGVVRNLSVFSLCMIVFPAVMYTLPGEGTIASISVETAILLVAKEALIGFIMGFIFSLVFFIAESIGSFIDTQRGSNMAQMFDPMLGEMSTPLGSLFLQFMITFFFISGGFLTMLGLFYKSFEIWPVFEKIPRLSALTPEFMLGLMDTYFSDMFLLAGPVMLILFLVEIGLGFMNRFAQQLNVFSLAMPIKSAMAFFFFLLYFAILFQLFQRELFQGFRLFESLKTIIV